jgi:hypothetical protein
MSSVDINYLASRQLPLAIRRQVEEMLGHGVNSDSYLCIALAGSHVLGFCDSRILKNFARIDTVMVREAHLATKLPQLLLHHSLRQMYLANVQEVNTTVPRDQIKLFLSCGFIEETITLPFLKKHQTDAIELVHPNLSALKKRFEALTSLETRAMEEETEQTKGLRDKGIAFDSPSAFGELGNILLGSAKQRVWILCESLEDPILRDKENIRLLQELAIRHRRSEVRILLAHDRQQSKGHKPVIDLAHKLSSFIQIRKLDRYNADTREWIYLCDDTSTILRKREHGFHGAAHLDNKAIAERARFQFEHKWQHSVPSIELRRLAI